MAMTPREAFKFGFLLRCADENLDDDATQERIKYACDLIHWDGKTTLLTNQELLEKNASIWNAVAGLAKGMGLAGLAGGAALGAGGGLLAAKATDKEIDPDEVKKQELIAAYKQQADRIRRQMAARSYRRNPSPRSPSFM